MIIRLIRKISTQISPDDFKVVHETFDIKFNKVQLRDRSDYESYLTEEQIKGLSHKDIVAVEIIQ